MDDDVFRAAHGLEGFADQMLARLHQHLNGDVIRDIVAVDQRAQNFIFRFEAEGKPTSISLKPISTSSLKKSSFS